MNTEPFLDNEHAIEMRDLLIESSIISDKSEIEYYTQMHGGADTTIFELKFRGHQTVYVQRIFRDTVSKGAAEFEFTIQKTLHEIGVSVPRSYVLKHPPNTYDRSFFIMDKIEGIGLFDALASPQFEYEELVGKFLQQLYRIHSIDISLFPQIPTLDIAENPYAEIDQALRRPKSLLNRYPVELSELAPVLRWLDEKKKDNPCEKLVLIHGDFHPFNIVIDENKELVVLDWTGINISDFRRDLGFATIALSTGISKNQAENFSRMYEHLSGTKVNNLEYFMILSSVFNLIRFYSGINNPTITGENEETMGFFKSIREYPLFLVDLIKDQCGQVLHQIKSYFTPNS